MGEMKDMLEQITGRKIEKPRERKDVKVDISTGEEIKEQKEKSE
jgi:hypothetical protein